MSPKQARFVDEYLIDLNATRAYKRAGYAATGHSAETSAQRLLRNDEVAQAVQVAIDARSQSLGIDADYVLTVIKETVERCRTERDSANIFRGSELLGRHLKMFTDKTEHSGTLSVCIDGSDAGLL